MRLSPQAVQRVIDLALEEDQAFFDATTIATVGDSDARATADLVAKEPGVLAGIEVAQQVFATLDPHSEFVNYHSDGDAVEPGVSLATVHGRAAAILSAERSALNLLQRMCGIASRTAQYVAAVKGSDAAIVDTRKTAPGLRMLDKYSVLAGGGGNHRMSLADCVLIKDNHIAAMKNQGLTIGDVVRHARSNSPFSMKIEIEVESAADALEAMEAGADIVMLDNMPPDAMRDAVEKRVGVALLEASGGVDLSTVAEIASAGVDIISVGELTHSVKALDISLDFRVG